MTTKLQASIAADRALSSLLDTVNGSAFTLESVIEVQDRLAEASSAIRALRAVIDPASVAPTTPFLAKFRPDGGSLGLRRVS